MWKTVNGKVLVVLNLQRMIALFMDYCRSKQLRPKTMGSYAFFHLAVGHDVSFHVVIGQSSVVLLACLFLDGNRAEMYVC